MDWARRRYRGHKVWIRVDGAGRPALDAHGLATMRYRPDDERTYSVKPAEVLPVEGVADGDTGVVDVWVAVVRGPGGRCGVGVRWGWRGRRRDASLAIRTEDPVAAGLEGARIALEGLRRTDLTIRLHVPEGVAAALRARPPTPPLERVVGEVRRRARALGAVRLERLPDDATASDALRAAAGARAAVEQPPAP